jgi:two-component system phosphate regulon sensor histidine kinase PhoR
MTLLSSVVFTGIILFCFAYTIMTILRQKKLGDIKNDFINNMTHEFKTPIATISLATDTILSPTILNNPDKVKRFANVIKQENKRLNGQVEKVLQAAIVDKSTFQLKMEEINLHDIIDHAINNFSLQIESREGTLNVDLQADNANFEGDLTHISNIVHNLLDNANPM